MSNIHRLSPRHKWSEAKENLSSGDIVLVVDDDVKRGEWKMAEVTKIFPGQDNLVRVVELRYAKGKEFKRPVTKLVLLMKKDERLDI